MENWRLAVLCSHLRPTTASKSSPVSPFICASGSENGQTNFCVFCKIIRGQSPALKLYEDDICLCILDTHPLSHGHSLIIPKSHFSSLEMTPPSVVAAMCSKVPFISNAIMKATGCGNLAHASPKKAVMISSQRIVSLHIQARDCLWTSESLRRRTLKLDQEASQLADRVREQLSFLNNAEESKDQGSSLTGD